MIKILLVDDQKYSVENIKQILMNSDLPIDELRSAFNAFEALDIAKEFKPNILLSDIKMPNLLGTDMAELLLKEIPDLNILFISGYAEKPYLQKAIKLHASGFIEKPIIEEELIREVSKIIASIKNSKSNLLSLNMILPIISDSLISGQCNVESLEQTVQMYNLEEQMSGKYLICILNLPDKHDKDIIRQQIELSFYEQSNLFVFTVFKDAEKLLIHIFGNELSTGNYKKIVRCAFKDFTKNISCLCHLAVGTLADTYKHSYNSYSNAVFALDRTFFYDTYSIVFYEELSKIRTPIDQNLTEQFRNALSSFDFAKSADTIKAICSQLKNAEILSSEAKKILFELSDEIYNFATDSYVQLNDVYAKSNMSYMVFHSNSIIELENYILSLIFEIERQHLQPNEQNYAKKAIEYISLNFQNPELSITDIAKVCRINPAYLCAKFKEQTGHNLNKFINRKRISEAKEQLIETNDTIAEISHRTGFRDSQYFCKVFNKYEKITPSQFRSIHSKNKM